MQYNTDVNVEFGHIYINENYSPEHYKSASLLRDFLSENKGLSVVKSLLIDNYNARETVLNIDGYIDEIGTVFEKPDFVILEKNLLPYADMLIGQLKEGKVKRQYTSYIEKNDHYPCSLLVATWNAARLGLIRIANGDFLHKNKPADCFYATAILSILPTRFGSVEKRALDILKESNWYSDNYEGRINHIFF